MEEGAHIHPPMTPNRLWTPGGGEGGKQQRQSPDVGRRCPLAWGHPPEAGVPVAPSRAPFLRLVAHCKHTRDFGTSPVALRYLLPVSKATRVTHRRLR